MAERSVSPSSPGREGPGAACTLRLHAMPASRQPPLYVVRDGLRVRVKLGGAILRPYVEVADRIRTAIVSGVLVAGDRLPSEHELRAAFDTSRDTVRHGLDVLTKEGLIRGEKGRGWFVGPPDAGDQ